VRELENLIQRLVILHRGQRISMKELPEKYRSEHAVAMFDGHGSSPAPGIETSAVATNSLPAPPAGIQWGDDGIDFNTLISDFEDRLILEAISRSGGNKKEAARLLNLKRTTLIEKIKKKNLPV
jgi:DNA-binding NtrC family response regulator